MFPYFRTPKRIAFLFIIVGLIVSFMFIPDYKSLYEYRHAYFEASLALLAFVVLFVGLVYRPARSPSDMLKDVKQRKEKYINEQLRAAARSRTPTQALRDVSRLSSTKRYWLYDLAIVYLHVELWAYISACGYILSIFFFLMPSFYIRWPSVGFFLQFLPFTIGLFFTVLAFVGWYFFIMVNSKLLSLPE